MVTVFLASVLRTAAPALNEREFPEFSGTLEELLEVLCREGGPGFRARLYDGARLRKYLNIYVDGKDIRYLGGVSTPIGTAARVDLIPAVAGG
jgi:molybdopterin synthase sulfur carrier subunit